MHRGLGQRQQSFVGVARDLAGTARWRRSARSSRAAAASRIAVRAMVVSASGMAAAQPRLDVDNEQNAICRASSSIGGTSSCAFVARVATMPASRRFRAPRSPRHSLTLAPGSLHARRPHTCDRYVFLDTTEADCRSASRTSVSTSNILKAIADVGYSAHADPGRRDPRGAGRSRRDRHRPDRHRQDGLVRPADAAHPGQRPGPGADAALADPLADARARDPDGAELRDSTASIST